MITKKKEKKNTCDLCINIKAQKASRQEISTFSFLQDQTRSKNPLKSSTHLWPIHAQKEGMKKKGPM
jgi:hypothetical protein